MMDEDLLRSLDTIDEVREIGRSAIFRRLAAEYIKRNRDDEIAAEYAQAYGAGRVVDELGGWTEEGVWPVN